MTKPDVYMPLFIGDYLAGTSRLTTLQHGAYLLIIMDYWMNGPPPADDAVLASITRLGRDDWEKNKNAILGFFKVVDGQLTHGRIEEELETARNKKKSKTEAGSVGGRKKWGESSTANKMSRSERLANARRLARHSAGEWNALLHVCGHSCAKCGENDPSKLIKDHITPIFMDGSDGIENLQPLCRNCNSSKGPDCTDFRPEDWRERLAERLAERLVNAYPSPSPSYNKESITLSSYTKENQNTEESSLASTKDTGKRKATDEPLDFSGWPSQPSEQTLKDWLKVRKAKKAPLTQTAINRLKAQFVKAEKFGFTVEDCLSIATTEAWRGFRYQWLFNVESSGGRPHAADQRGKTPARDTSAAGRARESAKRELEKLDRQAHGDSSLAGDGEHVRPSVVVQLRDRSRP